MLDFILHTHVYHFRHTLVCHFRIFLWYEAMLVPEQGYLIFLGMDSDNAYALLVAMFYDGCKLQFLIWVFWIMFLLQFDRCFNRAKFIFHQKIEYHNFRYCVYFITNRSFISPINTKLHGYNVKIFKNKRN